jgi:dipeptidyl-peptidase 4
MAQFGVIAMGPSLLALAGCHSPGTTSHVPIAAPPPPHLLTVAERSGYKATSRHEELIRLLDELAAASLLARRASMGLSTEGREIPLLILADPPVASAEEAKRSTDRLVVLLLGNIHAGEVDGKEALPVLAREILSEQRPALLRDLIILFAPNYNPDGNERVSKTNRPGQLGPEEGMGTRGNANGRDLNRDFVKVEEAETRALLGLLNSWDPAVVVDCHTTNGSRHRHVLTYAGAKVPAGDPEFITASQRWMLPGIHAAFERATTFKANWYGSFAFANDDASKDPTGWETFPPEARFATNYIGLRNRFAILSEGYSYAPYRDRVEATRAFCLEALKFSAANRREIARHIRAADRRVRAGTQDRPITIRTRETSAGPIEILGYEETWDGQRRVLQDSASPVHRTYRVELLDRWAPVVQMSVPRAYVIEARAVSERLKSVLSIHGVAFRELGSDERQGRLRDQVGAEVGPDVGSGVGSGRIIRSHRLTNIRQATREFQGHFLATYDTQLGPAAGVEFAPGSLWIQTTGQNGPLITYLLEPASEDGLTTWNFFDCCTGVGEVFPVHRVE